jgi:hypothetical protein
LPRRPPAAPAVVPRLLSLSGEAAAQAKALARGWSRRGAARQQSGGSGGRSSVRGGVVHGAAAQRGRPAPGRARRCPPNTLSRLHPCPWLRATGQVVLRGLRSGQRRTCSHGQGACATLEWCYGYFSTINNPLVGASLPCSGVDCRATSLALLRGVTTPHWAKVRICIFDASLLSSLNLSLQPLASERSPPPSC